MREKKWLYGLLIVGFLFSMLLLPLRVEAAKSIPAPKLQSVKLTSSTTISVKWNKVRSAQKYAVYCSEGGGKYYKLATTSDYIFIHKNCELSTEYKYKIKAISGKKKSKYSNAKSVVTNDNAYLLDLVQPYESPHGFTEYNGKSFGMGGDSYTHGFTCRGYGRDGEGSVTCFNLHGDYSKLSFIVGVVERAGVYHDSNKDCTIIIKKDGVVADSIVINPNNLPEKHEVDISDCCQLKICVTDGYYVVNGSGVYGFGELKVYK